MEIKETKNRKTQGGGQTKERVMELGREGIMECVRHLIGQEGCDLAFASGVMAGLALEVEQHGDGIEAMSPEARKRETLLGQIRFLLLHRSTEVLETIVGILRESNEVRTVASLDSA